MNLVKDVAAGSGKVGKQKDVRAGSRDALMAMMFRGTSWSLTPQIITEINLCLYFTFFPTGKRDVSAAKQRRAATIARCSEANEKCGRGRRRLKGNILQNPGRAQ